MPDSESSTSSSLLDRLRHQEGAAWARFTDLYTPTIYGWCRRGGLSPSDAADVAQEVLISVARSIGRFRRNGDGGSFGGWLAAITRNKIHDFYRQRGAQTLATGGTSHQRALHSLAAADEESAFSEQAQASESHAILARATRLVEAEFEANTWQAFWLTAVAGRSPADAAEALNVSVNAVYKARSRVLRRLRDELAGLI